MRTRCPECEEDILLDEPPEGPEVRCSTCSVDWAPGRDDPDPGWRVPAGGPPLWARVMERYDNGRAHNAFVDFSAQSSALDYAARRYRRALDRSGGTDEQASEALERIQSLAVASLAPRRIAPKRPVIITAAIALFISLAIAAATALLVGRLGQFNP